jgi:hypothetical protein
MLPSAQLAGRGWSGIDGARRKRRWARKGRRGGRRRAGAPELGLDPHRFTAPAAGRGSVNSGSRGATAASLSSAQCPVPSAQFFFHRGPMGGSFGSGMALLLPSVS